MTPPSPADIFSRYRPASDNEVRAESYGALKTARINHESDWRKQRGTFDDQTIFGPQRDFECACGKYVGERHSGIICDICGVKVTSIDARRTCCAHINLPVEILHPLATGGQNLQALPVLPVAYIESRGGAELLDGYDQVLRHADAEPIAAGFRRIVEVLTPLLVTSHIWNLPQRLLIAYGMALKPV